MKRHIKRDSGKLLGSVFTFLFTLFCFAKTPPVVSVDSGLLQGAETAGVISFKGIPYAAPPIGQLRWRAPQPVTPWTGIRTAIQYGHDCMQYPTPEDQALPRTEISEDCLFLNIWKPVNGTQEKLPVQVWIYGGGFVDGASSAAIYDGAAFAQRGVIFVSMNYRVGRFGFFAHPALSAEHTDGSLGNYAYQDQIAALKWVKRNISAFGGDPSNVTVMGESAGGYAIHTLMTSPLAKGLFHKAIIESGGGRTEIDDAVRLKYGNPYGYPSAEATGLRFAQQHGIRGTTPQALAALRALPASTVMGRLNMETDENSEEGKTFSLPMIDGQLMTAPPAYIYDAGTGINIPILIGTTSHDIGFPPEIRSMPQALDILGHEHCSQVKALYNPDDRYTFLAVKERIAGDQIMLEPARYIARTATKQGQQVYAFRFSYVASSLWATVPGAMHASEVAYVFNNLQTTLGNKVSEKDQAVADQIQQYWVNFARNSDPNSPSLPHWPRYDLQKDEIMIFPEQGATHTHAKSDPWRQRLDLVEHASPRY